MIKRILAQIALFLTVLFLMNVSCVNAQQTVFTEDFNAPGTPQNSSYTTNGSIGTSRWIVARSGNDFGAKIDGGILTLTNDATSAGNVKGWVFASTSTSNYLPIYNPILNQNPGIVTWNINIRQLRNNPAGLTDGLFGVGYILAGTAGSNNKVGKGYAIMLGQPGTVDAIRFATYNNGIATYYTKLSSSTSGLKDFGREYTSIRVEYNPANNDWSMYVRKDNASSFNDPKNGILIYQGKVANAEFVNEALTTTGAYWNGATIANQTAFFDNISVGVEVPEIISIDPDSKIANSGAFTLTVNGKGFNTGSKVYWNGSLRPTSFILSTQLTVSIPATDIPLPGLVPITVRNGTYISNSVNFEIEPSGIPTLTLSVNSLNAVSTVTGIASAPTNTYTINGVNLVGDATVNAPSNFEISKDGTTYADNLILPDNVGVGTLIGQPITLRARLKAGALPGNYTGNITHSTSGAVTKNVAVSGRVLATEPTTSASGIIFSNITSTGFKLNWTYNGNGAQRLVIIRQSTAVDALPTDATTYNANASFAAGSEIGTGNFVIYKGSGSSVQISGLTPTTVYYISIVEFNGVPATENYRTSGATGNTTTLNSPAGLQIKSLNTSYKINFDDTVDGVNLDTYQGVGIAQIAESGQLDSDSWAFTGFSSGAISFGGNSIEDSSYENGPSEGREFDTGMYAFNIGTPEDQNYTLGIQPGGTDYNPGTITLRLQNQTGAAITSLNIGYKVYVYNDQDSSSKISFSYGTTSTGTYTEQAIVDVVSPTTADLAPEWKAYYRSVIIPTVNIAANAYYYIRWSGSSTPTTGSKDEFGIDDIEVIANAGTNTVAFDGIVEDFVLQGNASLSADLSVQNRLQFNGGKLAIKDKTMTIAGSVTNTTANGLTGGASSKLIVRGIKNPNISFDQTANTLKVLDLFGANANTVSFLTNIIVNDSLKVNELQTLNLGTNTLLGTLNSIINNGIIQTQNTTATPFASGKTWAGSGILNMNAETPQTLVAGTYTNLTLSATDGTTAAANVTVNGILALPAENASTTKGSLSMATYTLVMGEDGINTGIGEVTGIIRRNSFTTNKIYTFGHPNSSITFPPGGTLPTSMSAKLTIGAAPSWRIGAIKRYFDIIQTGAGSTKALIRQHYLDSELNGNTESRLVFWGHKVDGAVDFEQGKSSNNSTDNWVEISNANVAQYFVSQFDKIFITLDDTQGIGEIVWNGSVSDSWTTLQNWTPNVKPGTDTKVIIPAGVPNYPTLNPEETIGSLLIETGAIVNGISTVAVPTPELFLTLGSGAWQNYGTFNPGTASKITFNNLDATISGNTTFNNVTIASGGGIRPSEDNIMNIKGALVNIGIMFTTLIPNTIIFSGVNQTIPNVNGLDFGGYHNLIISGTNPTIEAGYSNINIRGNLTLDQPLNFSGRTVNLVGISDQTIAGIAAINFNDLIVNKTTGATLLAQDITIGGKLTLTSSNLVIGDKNVTLGNTPVAGTFGTNTMIVADGTGFVRRPFNTTGSYFFPIGELTGAASYSPITVNVTAGTFSSAFVEVNLKDIKHPNNNSLQNYLRKYWNVNQTGITEAIATITGKYDALDVIGSESKIAAAQLKGTFDVNSNPWIKFTPLASNTLVATGASLTSGQNNVFTGLQAGAVSVEVFGYGDFCIGSTHTMEAVMTGGDAPYTYTWSNDLPNAAVVTIPTAAAGTTNYTLTVSDANGFAFTDTNIPVTIFPESVGGTIANNTQSICTAAYATTLVLTGRVGKILYWQRSEDINFTTDEYNSYNTVNIPNTTTTLTGAEMGYFNKTTYLRAVLKSGNCDEKYSNIVTITIKSTTWDGSWSNGAPDSNTSAILEADYTLSASITACSLTITNGAQIIVPPTYDVILDGALKVESGSLTLKSHTNLVQTKDFQNSGAITLERESSKLFRLDYTMWGSPLFGTQTLINFSPKTRTDRFYIYNSSTDLFQTIPASTSFTSGKGYLIRMPDNHIAYGATTIPESWTGLFKGTPTNGPVSIALDPAGEGYNMLANPYSSMIVADNFLTDNAAEIDGTIYFWRRRNAVPDASAYYATYTAAGGTGTAGSDSAPTQIPNGFIQVGQGFIVKKKGTGVGNAIFKNTMRTASDNNNQFFKSAENRSRIWLNVTNATGEFGQTLIAYMNSAENTVDRTDGIYLNDGSTALTSWLDNSEYIIQGRAPFIPSDVVALNFRTVKEGNYTIAIDHVDGLFSGDQNIYLHDRSVGSTHNLKTGAYNFTTTPGSFNSRFELVYETGTLVVDNPVFDSNSVSLYKKGGNLIIKSKITTLDKVEVFDFAGRLLATAKNINSKEVSMQMTSVDQVLIAKITSTDGMIISKKIIN